MNIMDAAGYGLGVLLLAKCLIRRRLGYRPPGWDFFDTGTPERARTTELLMQGLAWLTVFLLLYTFISAANARAAYDWENEKFRYRDCIAWLPHSYDGPATWRAFSNYLAWACFLWALRDWLWTLSESDRVAMEAETNSTRSRPFPFRLRRLLWVLSVNGAMLALEMLMQRIDGTVKLLWFRETLYNQDSGSQLGPFAYRANGAQYLNLIWPVTLGLWSTLERRAGRGRAPSVHHVLLVCAALMIIVTFISLSRGAVVVGAILLMASALWLGLVRRWRITPGVWGAWALLGLALVSGLILDWDSLAGRMKEFVPHFKGRDDVSVMARRMAEDFPVFGTGPETFQPVYLLYRISPEGYDPGQLHNDWLETRITFGWVGFGAILTALAIVLGKCFLPGGMRLRIDLVGTLWAAMAGCLLHARWDLPFQVYAIVLTFLAYCGILISTTRR